MDIFLNTQFVPASGAHISVADRGFRFGDGVFETIAVYAGVPYQWQWHQQRLEASLSAIRIVFDTAPLALHCHELIHRNGVKDGLLRIMISRGTGSRGYMPVPDSPPTLVIETGPLPVIPTSPIALWHSALEKISPRALPVNSKLAQGLQSTLAKLDAQDHHCADALLLNASGDICETSSANIFWLAQGRLYTPSLACGVLNGSTRAAILRLSPWPVEEGKFPLAALKEAHAVFLTNAAFRVLPVAALLPEGWGWDSAETAATLDTLLLRDIANA